MDRIADFNISSNRQRHRNTNSCNVVINNNHSVTSAVQRRVKPRSESQYGLPPLPPPAQRESAQLPKKDNTNVVYPSVTPTFAEPSPYEEPQVVERDVTLAESEPLNGNELDLFKTIAKTFGEILRDNNPKLIANLIDQSGKFAGERSVRLDEMVQDLFAEAVADKTVADERLLIEAARPLRAVKAMIDSSTPISRGSMIS